MTAETDSLAALLAPVVTASGLDVEGLRVSPAGRRRRVELAVDRDGGVTLDECAELAREISDVLDAANPWDDQPYVLEVGSPGTDRPLTHPRHWRRNVGRLVRVVPTSEGALAGSPPVVGRVVGWDDDSAELDVDGGRRRVAYADIASARVQVEFTAHAAGAEADDEIEEG